MEELKKIKMSCRVCFVLLNLCTYNWANESFHPDAIANPHGPGENNKPDALPYIVANKNSLKGLVLDETEAKLVGQWHYSTHTPPYVGLGYLHDNKSNKGLKRVIYTPRVKRTGTYELRISHCSNIRRSTRTLIKVKHKLGWSEVRINQAEEPEHKRLFRTVGYFTFEAGEDAKVIISNEGSEKNKVVIADAIQLLWLGEKQPAKQ